MPICRPLFPVGGGFIRPVFFYSNFKSGLDESSPYPGHDASCLYIDQARIFWAYAILPYFFKLVTLYLLLITHYSSLITVFTKYWLFR